MEHLDDRPRSVTAGAGSGPPARRATPEDVNWYPLVRAAFLAALTAFLVKLVALGFLANRDDVSLEVGFWKGFIPHLTMQLPPTEFARIVTTSTFVMAVVSTVIFAAMVLRTNVDKMVVWGWFMGVFVTFETLCLELLRHALEPPVVDPTTVWRTAVPLTAGAAIAVVYALVTRERIPRPTTVPARAAVLAAPDGARAVDARPAAFQGAAAVPTPPAPVAPVPPAEPAPDPVPVGAGATAGVSAALAAAAVPNRIVDARPAQLVADPDPADLPPARSTTSRPAADVGPAPIVDTRPVPASPDGDGAHGPNALSTRAVAPSKD
ncbi:MAG: hypothetical protein KDB10_01645 [Acidimicrobiales bacterium]|nr:hypothetical protein [Acidimicrobiales bacterium]